MRRRGFLAFAGGAAAAWPLTARAQQPAGRSYRVGFMVPAGRDSSGVVAFFDELRLFDLIEGQNLEVVPGGFDVRNDELVERATAVVNAKPDVIVCGPDLYASTLQRTSSTVPIVTMTEDILAAGLV